MDGYKSLLQSPWYYGYTGTTGYCIYGGGQHIATVLLYKRDGGDAIARLMTAAPELLAALRRICSTNGFVDVEALNVARAAISRATGEAA